CAPEKTTASDSRHPSNKRCDGNSRRGVFAQEFTADRLGGRPPADFPTGGRGILKSAERVVLSNMESYTVRLLTLRRTVRRRPGSGPCSCACGERSYGAKQLGDQYRGVLKAFKLVEVSPGDRHHSWTLS